MMKKIKWENNNDEAHGLIGMSISHNLRFHLQGIDNRDESWEAIESMFGKHNTIRARRIENKIKNLIPNDFSYIEYYLCKFKTFIIFCEECKINMEEEHCIYIILANLSISYSVFVSTFYGARESLGISYKNPSLDSFCDALIREQYKLMQLGVVSIASTSNKSLAFHHKDKPKNPKKKHPHQKNKKNKAPKPSQLDYAPNGDKGGKY
jgi:hypothetical protein